ncbi:GGDEF domain-containing protein [Rhodococcus sovatensis]|uniref:GGDEF domain-containing protein n=1 Tax=Rhodococcus sovatensis TaxID=1805840 RepID=A0ABZ2PLS0_9NOCA
MGITGRWIPRTLRGRTATNPAAQLERKVGRGIAVLVPVFAVIGTVVLFSGEGPSTAAARAVCVVVLLSTIPVGLWWWVHGRDVVRMPGWFVFYADVGVATVLLTFAQRGLALHATGLFAVIGIYIAYFSSKSVLRAHSGFVSVVIVAFAVAAAFEGTHSSLSIVAQALVVLVVANSVLVFRAVIKAQLELAITDSLTGLLNRRGFEIRIERMLLEAKPGESVTVFVVDLDRFKFVNDTCGHAAGDAVLRSTAYRLANAVPEGSCVARTGGEEFTIAVLMEPSDVLTLADSISGSLSESTDEISITGSVGAAMISVDKWKARTPSDGSEMVHAVLLKADNAMYEAKRAGGDQAKVFGA